VGAVTASTSSVDVPGVQPAGAKVVRCVADARADFERQGGLTADDVYRLVASHRLTPDEVVAVFAGLSDLGLDLDEGDDDQLDTAAFSGASINRLGSHSILTAADEVALGRRIRLGLEALERVASDGPSSAEAEQIRDGREAHRALVRSNVRLVMSIARRSAGQGLDLDDLIQEGMLGLMRAADKFDHTLGFKFSTYATWWIRQSIERGLANSSRNIRLPVHVVEDMSRLRRIRQKMESVRGRAPTLQELSFELDMKPEKVSALMDYARGVVSLDLLVGEDTTIGDLQSDPGLSPQWIVENEILRNDVEARLQAVGNELGARAEDILRRRFGFAIEGELQTLDEVGKLHGVTRERIRQIESKTLKSDFVRDLFCDLEGSWFNSDAV
jgi:RNA polymerase primary sigma factor